MTETCRHCYRVRPLSALLAVTSVADGTTTFLCRRDQDEWCWSRSIRSRNVETIALAAEPGENLRAAG